jgi:hypothetical protein
MVVKNPKTYFEKIPVATVKRILARQDKQVDSGERGTKGRTSQAKPGRPAPRFSGRNGQS